MPTPYPYPSKLGNSQSPIRQNLIILKEAAYLNVSYLYNKTNFEKSQNIVKFQDIWIKIGGKNDGFDSQL